MITVIQGQLYQRPVQRGAISRPIKNDVDHLIPPQGLGGLLPHHPANRFNNVALTTSVGTDNPGDPGLEVDDRLFRKGLKAINL